MIIIYVLSIVLGVGSWGWMLSTTSLALGMFLFFPAVFLTGWGAGNIICPPPKY